MKRFVCKSLLGLSLALGCAAQAAADINIAFQETLGVNLWTSGTSQYQTGAMQYLMQGGASFQAFCIEIPQDPSAPSLGFQTYTVSQFSGQTAQLMQGLFSSSYGGVDTALERAAFQVAVWELTHETSNTFDASYEAGSFYFKNFSADASDAELLAFEALTNSYLSAATSYQGPALYEVQRLQNAAYQDLVTAAPVPEPATYGLMLAGLGLIGFVKRRRQA